MDVRRTISSSESALENITGTFLKPITFLTKKQRKNIVSTWLEVKDRPNFGLRVYEEVFRRQPKFQEFFSSSQCQLPKKELEKSSEFRAQATAFADFLDYIVGFVHLDSANFIFEASTQIGRRHAQRLKSIDCIPHNWWQTFCECVLLRLRPYFPVADGVVGRLPVLRHLISRSYRRSWRILLNVVVEKMQLGFCDYKNQERQFVSGKAPDRKPPVISPYQSQLKKLAAIATAVQKKSKKFCTQDNGYNDSSEEDLWNSEDTSSGI